MEATASQLIKERLKLIQKLKLWLGHRRALYARWSLPGVPQGPAGLPQSLWLFRGTLRNITRLNLSTRCPHRR